MCQTKIPVKAGIFIAVNNKAGQATGAPNGKSVVTEHTPPLIPVSSSCIPAVPLGHWIFRVGYWILSLGAARLR